MIREDLPLLLKRKRLERGLTLEQAGKLLGVSKTTYRDYENNVLLIKNMKIDKLIPLSFFLEMMPNQMFNIKAYDSYTFNKIQFRESAISLLKTNVADLDEEDRKYLIKSIELICGKK